MPHSGLSFDTLRRFVVYRELLALAAASGSLRVLDVGGHPGMLACFLREELPAFDVLTVDVIDQQLEGYRFVEPGKPLPFADAEFDVAVSSDVLEHVPGDQRGSFIRELARVSRLGVILGAPFESPSVNESEAALNSTYEEAFPGSTHRWLSEHVEFGLPSRDEVAAAFDSAWIIQWAAAAPLESRNEWQWASLLADLREPIAAAFRAWDDVRNARLLEHPDSEYAWMCDDSQPPFIPYRWFAVARRAGQPAWYRTDGGGGAPFASPEEARAATAFWREVMLALATRQDGGDAGEIDGRLARALALAEEENRRLRGTGGGLLQRLFGGRS